MSTIKLSIDVTKITKEKLYLGRNGAKYLSAVLIENRDGPDQYGNDGMVIEDVTKEEREGGKRGVIIGNYKTLGKPMAAKPRTAVTPAAKRPAPAPVEDDDDDIPF